MGQAIGLLKLSPLRLRIAVVALLGLEISSAAARAIRATATNLGARVPRSSVTKI